MERAEPRHVRLEFPQALGADALDVRDAVRERPPLELLQSGKLGPVGGDYDLAAAENRDALRLAVLDHPGRACDAQLRLQRARRVVHAPMDDAARVAGLV